MPYKDGYYSYGPIIFTNNPFDNNDKGNYMYPGSPPVDCDEDGIPIDDKGLQCLSNECVLHPDYVGEYDYFSEFLGISIPSVESAKQWFDKNLFDTNEKLIKKYIIRHLLNQRERRHALYMTVIKKLSEYSRIEDFCFLVFASKEEIEEYNGIST